MKKANKLVEASLPTDWGRFRMIAYNNNGIEQMPHLVMVHPEMDPSEPVMLRIHSECITGDLFHSRKCDCGSQLDRAMSSIYVKRGVLIYLRQEGRGIGIINKLKAYNLQDKGHDTVEANTLLGLEIDSRDYSIVLEILRDLDITRVELLTNNPEKLKAFEDSEIELTNRIPLVIEPTGVNHDYLKAKQDLMGHLYNMDTKE